MIVFILLGVDKTTFFPERATEKMFLSTRMFPGPNDVLHQVRVDYLDPLQVRVEDSLDPVSDSQCTQRKGR